MTNATCVPGNLTDCGGPPKSSAGLAVGLTFLFLALGIAAAVAVYTQRDKLRNMLQLGQGRSQKKEEHTEIPQDHSSQYTSMIRAPSETQAPIYENFTGQNAGNRTMVDMDRSHGEPEEDVYLECDSPDDAIYSNDPALNLDILPDSQEEDLYVVPDGL